MSTTMKLCVYGPGAPKLPPHPPILPEVSMLILSLLLACAPEAPSSTPQLDAFEACVDMYTSWCECQPGCVSSTPEQMCAGYLAVECAP